MLFAEVRSEPLGDLWLPLNDGTVATEDVAVRPGILDLARLTGPPLERGTLETEGDLFRVVQPFVRVPWVEALLGTPIRATIMGGSMRTEAFVESWDDWFGRPVSRDAEWMDLLVRMTEMLVERAACRRAVAPTLMRGPCDLAEAVLGPELMCLSMYDHPAQLRAFLKEATSTFIDSLDAQLAVIPTIAGGHVNQFGIWAPGTVVRTQCDASAILSPKHYADWYLPWDQRICEAFDFSIIHLHSVSLHTIEPLLSVDRPQAVQVTLETTPGAPTLDEMMPTFRRVLETKCLVVDGQLSADEVTRLQSSLPQGGLCIIARRDSW